MSHALSGKVFFLLLWLPTSVAIRQHVVNEALLANHEQIIETINAKLKTQVTADDAIRFIAGKIPDLKSALKTAGEYVTVTNYDEFAKIYLKEYNLPGNELKSRKKWFKTGKFTGMTAPSGKIYVLQSSTYGEHDAVHEIIHLLRGGPENQIENSEGLDECFTEYYAKKLCQILGITDSPVAYPVNYDFMRRLEELLNTELGAAETDRVLFETFWKRHEENNEYRIDVLAEAIARKQIEKAQNINYDNPLYYKPATIKTYNKKVKKYQKKMADYETKLKKFQEKGGKEPKKPTPVAEPRMMGKFNTYLGADARELTTQTEVAKKMLMNWNFMGSDVYWEEIMGIEPRKRQKNEKKQKQKKKKANRRQKRGTN
jgi:hypothetical protein